MQLSVRPGPVISILYVYYLLWKISGYSIESKKPLLLIPGGPSNIMGLMKNRCLLYPFIHISELKLHWEITNWIFFFLLFAGKTYCHKISLTLSPYQRILIYSSSNKLSYKSQGYPFIFIVLPSNFFTLLFLQQKNICKHLQKKKKKRVEGIKKQLAMHMSWKIGKMLKNSKKIE